MKKSSLIKIFSLTLSTLMLSAAFTACGVGRNNDYYNEKILSVIEEEKEVKLSEIFDFEFDSAYLSVPVFESYSDKDHFLDLLDVESKLKINSLDSEGFARILFIKDKTIIYDFRYVILDYVFTQTGILVNADTEIKYLESNEYNIPVIQISGTVISEYAINED